MTTKKNKWGPETDGQDHINVYSRGRTWLGRQLTNFAHTPFSHHRYGSFESMEGFWHYIATGQKYREFRELYGYRAKKAAKGIEKVPLVNFKDTIREGLVAKITQNPEIYRAMAESELPFAHYYCFGSQEQGYKVHYPESSQWLMEVLEDIRGILATPEKVQAFLEGTEIPGPNPDKDTPSND